MRAVRVGVGVLIPWHFGLLQARARAFSGSGMGWGVEERSIQRQRRLRHREEVSQSMTKGLG